MNTCIRPTLPALCLLALSLAAGNTYAKHNHYNKLERPVTDEIIYFVLPDRFNNGDTRNDHGDIAGTKFDNGFDPADKSYFHGGDLKGLTKKLDYIRNLGATAIWIAPVFKNDPTYLGTAGYHGYWPLDFKTIDPHFGSNEDFSRFVKKAHKRGMKVYLDIVVNHTGNRVLVEECHNADGSLKEGLTHCPYRSLEESASTPYTPFVRQNGEMDKNPLWLNDPQKYHNQGESTFEGESSLYGDFGGLDDLNTEDPEVVAGMIDIFKFWISEFRIDGFRLDTVKHVSKSFWQEWTPAIRAHAEAEGISNFAIFGEIFDGDPRTVSDFTRSAEIPSALDFGMYYPTTRVFSGQTPPSDLLWAIERDDMYTDSDSHANNLVSFISNHDVGRFGHILENQLTDATEAEKLQRLRMAHAYMFFARGIPTIYYGDEQGFTGGEDADGREDMMASQVASFNDNNLIGSHQSTAADNFNHFHPMYRTIRKFSRIYKRHAALRSGAQFVRYAESSGPGMLAISRVGDNNKEYLIVFNTDTIERTVELEATSPRYKKLMGKSDIAMTDDLLNVTLPPLGFTILKSKKAIEPDTNPLSAELSIASAVNGVVNGLVELNVSISNEANPLPINSVAFHYQIADGELMPLGVDKNPSYGAFWDTSNIAMGTPVTVIAEVTSPGMTDPIVLQESLTVDQVEGMHLTFKKPDHWVGANLYFFDAAIPSPNWPGTAMRHHGDGWYSYQFPDGINTATVIFNDGAGNQTDNLPKNGSGCFVDNTWVDSCVLPFTVTLQKPAGWGNDMHIHYWNADGASNTAWPGLPMTAVSGDWYSYTFPYTSSIADLIFNDNAGNQTANLQRSGSGCYIAATDQWQDECAIPTDTGPLGDMYIRGSLNGWGVGNPLTYEGNSLYTVEVDLAAGSIEFKIANADWSTNFGSSSEPVMEIGVVKSLDPGAGNLTLSVDSAGVYRIEIDASAPDNPTLLILPQAL